MSPFAYLWRASGSSISLLPHWPSPIEAWTLGRIVPNIQRWSWNMLPVVVFTRASLARSSSSTGLAIVSNDRSPQMANRTFA